MSGEKLNNSVNKWLEKNVKDTIWNKIVSVYATYSDAFLVTVSIQFWDREEDFYLEVPKDARKKAFLSE